MLKKIFIDEAVSILKDFEMPSCPNLEDTLVMPACSLTAREKKSKNIK